MEIKPEILAPAGDEDCFLAALAAGANAIYLGLKQFSARMEAENFGVARLCRMAELAHKHNARVYVAMNTIIKPNELSQAYRQILRLGREACADGLIIQDLALLDIARQADFKGIIAFSTLANASSPQCLKEARKLGASRVILPRELSVDEMRDMAMGCPAGLELECFVHGALCYCVSGRCYWSSYLGGKSGLRGRCVQPCRRVYNKLGKGRQHGARFFSCQDLEIGALVKILLNIPQITSWKIEGRKKGPHYVFHTVTAYRLLRDNGADAKVRKQALELLQMALGRPGVPTKFLPQGKTFPTAPGRQTSSGLLAGKISADNAGKVKIKARLELLPGDYLRIGVEDERWHATLSVKRGVPKGGEFVPALAKHKTPGNGVPVFLIDRREHALQALLFEWRKKLDSMPEKLLKEPACSPCLPLSCKPELRSDMQVFWPKAKSAKIERGTTRALWLTPGLAEDMKGKSANMTVYWLLPDIWPDNEDIYRKALEKLLKLGARHFVCNSVWQRSFFPDKLPMDMDLIAGPFCNITNGCAVKVLAYMGFTAAFAATELARQDLLALPGQSPLPLGFVLGGFWPAGISRFGLNGINAGEVFQSPLNETFWSKNHGGTIWIYPGWPIDLKEKREELVNAGYSFFAFLNESVPLELSQKKRQGHFNWDGRLL